MYLLYARCRLLTKRVNQSFNNNIRKSIHPVEISNFEPCPTFDLKLQNYRVKKKNYF